MKRTPQFELPVAGEVFNLSSEHGFDAWLHEHERFEQAKAEAEAKAYEAKMQRTLEQCPGFTTCDPPTGPGSHGKVVVEPGKTLEAFRWLKRRFHVNENLELSGDIGLVLEIAPRIRRVTAGGRKVKVRFGRPEQFSLPLD